MSEKAKLEEKGQERRQPRLGVARPLWDTPTVWKRPADEPECLFGLDNGPLMDITRSGRLSEVDPWLSSWVA